MNANTEMRQFIMITTRVLKKWLNKRIFMSILFKFCLVFLICYALTMCFLSDFSGSKIKVFHILVEAGCIWVALSVYVVTWYAYENTRYLNRVIGFGLLAVAVFDFFHIFFSPELKLNSGNYYDISTKYWVAGRLAEAAVILSGVLKFIKIKIDKYLITTIVISLSMTGSIIIYAFPHIIPELITPEGSNFLYTLFGLVIIFFFVVSLFLVGKSTNDSDLTAKKYICTALTIAIASVAGLLLYNGQNAIIKLLCNLLKFSCYLYLFKAILVSAVIYPRKRSKKLIFKKAKKDEKILNMQLQMQTILDSLENPAFIMSKNNKVILCNEAFEESLEMEAKSIVGMDMEQLGESLKVYKHEMPEISPYYKKQCFKIFFQSAKGSQRELLIQMSPITNADGEKVGILGVATDITGVKQEQQKLQQQEKLALLGQMGAAIVHETKNYLATIKATCQMLKLIAQDEKIKDYSLKIDKATGEVNKIITDFLTLSKPKPPELKEALINDLILSVKSIIETSSIMRGIEIYVIPNKNEKSIMCDESQIKQVILNISKNAMEAMENVKNPRLIIGTELDDKGDEMLVTISDNGNGIPDEIKAKIGTPFFTTKEGGTGLGLSVCFQIIKAHGGSLDIESEAGKGTTFIIRIPCKASGNKPENGLDSQTA